MNVLQKLAQLTQFIKVKWKTFLEYLSVNRRSLIAYGLCLCFILAIFGQWYLDERSLGNGLIIYGLAGIIFVIAIKQAEQLRSTSTRFRIVLRQPGLIIIPILLCLVVIKRVHDHDLTPAVERMTLISWLVDILLFCAITLFVTRWRPAPISRLFTWIKSHRLEFGGIVLLLAVGLFLRFINIQNTPFPPLIDEGDVGVETVSLLHGQQVDLFGVGWASQPVLSHVGRAVSVFLFGNTIPALRVISALEGALTILFLYFLARQEFGIRTGFLAAGALVALPIHLHFSRLGVDNILPAFFATLSVWLFMRALRNRRTSSYLWAGLSVGFSLYNYVGSRLVIALLIGLLLYVILFNRRMLTLPGTLVFLGIIVIVAAPMATFFRDHMDQFLARMNGESIFANSWLEVHAASVGMTYLQVLWDQFTKSALAFVSGGAPQGFFNASQPYFPVVASIFLIFGMTYTAIKIRQPIFIGLMVWFWAAIVFGSTITVNAPTSERMVMSVPAAALMVGLGIDLAFQAFEKIELISTRLGWIFSLALICGVSIYGAVYYFGDYQTNDLPKDYANQVMSYSIDQALKLGPNYQFYLLGKPYLSFSFGNFAYLLPNYTRTELTDTVENLLTDYQPNKGAIFVAIPDQYENLRTIESLIPGGKETEYNKRDIPDQALYSVYIVPPGS